jgi:hypothetical protein
MERGMPGGGIMDLYDFIRVYERAKAAQQHELDAIRIPNPRLRHYTFFATLEGLRSDWRELEHGKDPGKHKPHRFFVREFRLMPEPHDYGPVIDVLDRAWAREIVDDLRAADKGFDRPGCIVGTRPPLAPFANVAKTACPACGVEAVVVGSYDQTRNSFEYDEWTITLSALCLRCAKVTGEIARRSECRRIPHLLAMRPW